MTLQPRSFGDFLDEICTPDLLERVRVEYDMDEAQYRRKVWEEIKAGIDKAKRESTVDEKGIAARRL